MPTGTYRKELVDWLRSLYGPDRAYKTARRLSLAAGRNQNAVATVEERGHATAEVIADLARAAGVSPLEAFHRAGWLTEEEISSRNEGPISVEEADLLRMYRETKPDLRGVVVAGLRGAWATSRGET